MNSETENEAEPTSPERMLSQFTLEPEPENDPDDVSMYSETNSESSKDENGALIELMEEQIYDQNIQIQELKKQIEDLKSLLISQFPHYLNAVLKYV